MIATNATAVILKNQRHQRSIINTNALLLQHHSIKL